jgi:hypothetical protein
VPSAACAALPHREILLTDIPAGTPSPPLSSATSGTTHDLDFVGCDSEGEPVSLRELLVHMIEEYARHNGHADLLRERIDGRVGQ